MLIVLFSLPWLVLFSVNVKLGLTDVSWLGVAVIGGLEDTLL